MFSANVRDTFTDCVAATDHYSISNLIDFGICVGECDEISSSSNLTQMQAVLEC